jgi:hypothetical protein
VRLRVDEAHPSPIDSPVHSGQNLKSESKDVAIAGDAEYFSPVDNLMKKSGLREYSPRSRLMEGSPLIKERAQSTAKLSIRRSESSIRSLTRATKFFRFLGGATVLGTAGLTIYQLMYPDYDEYSPKMECNGADYGMCHKLQELAFKVDIKFNTGIDISDCQPTKAAYTQENHKIYCGAFSAE